METVRGDDFQEGGYKGFLQTQCTSLTTPFEYN